MVNKQDPTPEFQIENEDFPALPGAQSKTVVSLTSLQLVIVSFVVVEMNDVSSTEQIADMDLVFCEDVTNALL